MRSFRRIALALVLSTVQVFPTAAIEAGLEWLPGFPLRAGTIVVLRWTPVPGATAYRVYKKEKGADFRAIGTGPQTIFNDINVPVAETVSYRVTALVGEKETPPSAVATLKGQEPLSPPAFYGATYPTGAITLRWSTPPGTMFFNLYRSDGKGGPFTLLDSTHQDVYTDRSVKRGKTYFYKVTAVDGNSLESGASPPLETRLPPEVAAVIREKPVLRKVVPTGEFYGEEFYPLVQPADVGLAPGGEVYVLDRNSIQFFDRDGNYVRRVNLDRKWSPPSGAVVDRDGKFLVSFYSEGMLRKIDDEGKAIDNVAYPPAETGFPNNPNNSAICRQGFRWIADGSRFQVVRIDRGRGKFEYMGRLRGTYERKEKAETDLPALTRIQYNPVDGKLYAVLGVTAEIKVIDPETRKVTKTFGGLGLENRKFQGIGGLAFRRNGNVLVLDHLMQVVKEFDRDHEYVATYADVVEKDDVRLSSNLITTFAFREDIGRFYVSSTLENRVYMFDIAR